MSLNVGFNFDACKTGKIKWRMNRFLWEMRYAWQRAWRGYDDVDVFELGDSLARRIPVLLREFKKYYNCYFDDPDYPDRPHLTKEEGDALLDRMIFCFENCDDDVLYKRLYGKESWEEEYDAEKQNALAIELGKCEKEAMHLLSKWIWRLWY